MENVVFINEDIVTLIECGIAQLTVLARMEFRHPFKVAEGRLNPERFLPFQCRLLELSFERILVEWNSSLS